MEFDSVTLNTTPTKKPRRRSPTSNAKRAAWIAEKLASAAPECARLTVEAPSPQPDPTPSGLTIPPLFTYGREPITPETGRWSGRYWVPNKHHI
jgi:hypothetical protein